MEALAMPSISEVGMDITRGRLVSTVFGSNGRQLKLCKLIKRHKQIIGTFITESALRNKIAAFVRVPVAA